MTPRKKLIEVSLPLAKINQAAAREKSIRHGHPSTLHLWWARRPLAACRAVLFASLVDDPESDPAYRWPDGSVMESAYSKRADLFALIEELVQWENSNNRDVIRSARAEIARCVASQLVEKGQLKKEEVLADGITVADLIEKGHCRPVALGDDKKGGGTRYQLDASRLPPAEVIDAFLAEYAPPVLDPFCGGGSIPLEAQRLGLRAYASDLNPVAVLITKALIEIPPKFAGRPPVNPEWQKKSPGEKAAKVWHGAEGLAEDVRYYGKWMRDEAEKRIGHLYPKVKITRAMAKDRPDLEEYVGQELTVIAWLWARTVASPNPAVKGAHVPLVRSFWLSTKKGKEAWVRPMVTKVGSCQFQVCTGEPPDGFDPQRGTVVRKGGRCLLTDSPIPLDYIRTEGKSGRMGARLMAVVAEGARSRVYLPPIATHAEVAESAVPKGFPETDLPQQALSMRVMLYGMDKHYKLFTPRQLVALTTFSDLVAEAREKVHADAETGGGHLARPMDRMAGETPGPPDLPLTEGGTGPTAYSDAMATYLAFGSSKAADYNTTLVSWINQRDQARSTFSKQALPMIWDFTEVNPLARAAGDPSTSLDGISEALECLVKGEQGEVSQRNATAIEPSALHPLLSTDPPYYDNIGYADLSDFFYVWLRRSLGQVYRSLFGTLLTPKGQELIASPYRHEGDKGRAQEFFEHGLGKAFAAMRQVQGQDYPLTVYYAFKQAESEEDDEEGDGNGTPAVPVSTGWETMLSGLVRAGFSICGTWPMRTERSVRSVGLGTNALASSIVLVCRPRPANAPHTARKEFIRALRQELPWSLRNLQIGNIAPVDLAQAAIGPGMAVFTRYAKVLESDGSAMPVRTALGLINQVLDEVLAEQEGEFDAATRWALAWFEQFGMKEGSFGEAETLSKAKNTAVGGLVEAGVVKAGGGKVRLLRRDELPAGWEPDADARLSVWETVQHLIRVLDQQGESGAAVLVNRLGSKAEIARDLAYRLYTICERKKWADEALAYNGLVIAWPELTKLAQKERGRTPEIQKEMF